MAVLAIIEIGDSEGVILPKEMLETLQVSAGDKLYFTETRDGFLMVNYDSDFARCMEAGKQILKEDAEVFRKLVELGD